MSEQEIYAADKEAAREMAEHPEKEPLHGEAMARYISGIAYEEKRRDERDEQDHAATRD